MLSFVSLVLLPGLPAALALHLKSTRQPEERMHAAKNKCADQQRSHAPERPEEKRIFLRIVMRRVRQVPCKPPVGSGMTLLTSTDNLFSAQMRAGVGNWEDVMSTVTIIALRCFSVAKLRYFPVVGIEVCLRDRLVTPSTLRHDLELESCFIRTPDGMRCMTIVADRQRFVGLPNQDRVDAQFELLLNPVMTPTARLRNILWINARERIGLRQHAVGRVATGARCRHCQPALHQPFAMDAFGVVLDDLMLRAGVADGRFLSFPMALRTQEWDIRCESCGIWTQLSEYEMCTVTFLARRGVGVIFRGHLPMRADLILLRKLGMTG